MSTDKTSILNSDKLLYMKMDLSSNQTQYSSFPWEIYFDNMHHLEETKMLKGKALLMFPNGLLMSAFDETFGEDYNYHMDDVPGLLDTVINAFTFRENFSNPARAVLKSIAHHYRKNNPKKCHDCGKTFHRKDNLDRHVKIHQKENSQESCKDCDANFSTSDDLERHVKTVHEKVKSKVGFGTFVRREKVKVSKQFLCNECSKTFNSIANLKRHMLSGLHATSRKKT